MLSGHVTCFISVESLKQREVGAAQPRRMILLRDHVALSNEPV